MFDHTRLLALPTGILTAFALAASSPAMAQAPDLSGKQVQMIIGFGAGGGYDRWGRTVARHISKHLPGKPNVIPQNMPGGGSFQAANFIFSAAPKDGTAMAIIARDAPLGPISGMQGARFDPLKMTWLGTPTTETNVCFAHKRAKVKNFADLLKDELIIGNTGAGTGTYSYPKALNGLLGTKFKLVSGFKVSTDVLLATERGEVDGLCESWDSAYGKRPELFEDGTFNVLFQAGADIHPEIKGPSVFSFAKTPEMRQALDYVYVGQSIGRPFIAPPDLPPAVLKMVHDAFTATMNDPEYIAEVKKLKLDHDPKDGAFLEKIIKQVYATPQPLVDKIAALIK